jgi:penicillin amidase
MTPVYLDALEDKMEGTYFQAQQILASWDYQMAASSSAALIFEILWLELNRAMFHDELGDENYPLMIRNNIIAKNLINQIRITGSSGWCDNVLTKDKLESFQDNIEIAFKQTVDTLASRYGSDPSLWQWGDLHKVALIHPMGNVDIVDKLFKVNRGPYSIGGASHTVCPYRYPLGHSFIANHGASERHIFHTADWDLSLSIIPTGASGVPASPHYLDQTSLYLENKYRKDHFSKVAVESNIKYKAVFE